MSLIGANNEQKIWNYLMDKLGNAYGVASVMANLNAESGLNPKNLENTGNNKLGMTDDNYTKAVDDGTYINFINDCYGYGICQWTYWSRKKALYEFAKSRNVSIGDLEMQLDFLMKELSENYKSVLSTLKTAKNVFEATSIMMLKFECPYDQSIDAQNKRAAYGQNYFNKYVINQGGDTMSYLSYVKGQNAKLSTNFISSEFDCHGNGCCRNTVINEQLVEYLQKIRDHFGKPITITSAYRCATHNRNVGGATGSRHTKGDAADIVVSGVAPREVAKYAESIGIKGIGLYETNKDGHFVHIDTRSSKSFWYGQAQAYRSTFGGTNSSSVSNSTTSKPSSNGSYSQKEFVEDVQRALGVNDDGIAGPQTLGATVTVSIYKNNKHGVVKHIQNYLKSLGEEYDPGTADGIYGGKTRIAVMNFQKVNGCVADGVITAGNKTWKKLLGMK